MFLFTNDVGYSTNKYSIIWIAVGVTFVIDLSKVHAPGG